MKKPKSLSKEIVFNHFLKICEETLQFPSGYKHQHFTLSLPTEVSVSVIACDQEENLIINREYRHAAGQEVLSLPGGFLNQGESPIEGGQRELLEETGYFSENLKIIGRSYPMPGICDQLVTYILAKECRKTQEPKLDGGEIIETDVISYEKLQHKIQSGTVVDGILLAGLWFSKL